MNRLSRKQTRSFERLEDRSMLAGNVTAAINEITHCLEITGDTKGNVIAVYQNNQGAWVVQGFAKTTINGGNAAAEFTDVPCIHIDTGDGDDIVGVGHGTLPEELVVNTGAGKDAAVLIGLKVGSLCVDTGTSSDLLLAAGIQVTPSNNPSFVPTEGKIEDGLACFNTGDGDDIAVLAGIKATNVSLCTGKGNDYAGLLGVCVDECLSVDTGSGRDLLGVVKSSARFAKIYGGTDAGDIYLTAKNSFGSQSTDYKITVKIDPLVSALASWAKSLKSTVSPVLSSLGAFPDLKI
jgi:hypothetical protein